MPAVVVSLLSLTVSMLAFYAGNFREKRDLFVVTDFQTPTKFDGPMSVYGSKFEIPTTIVNAGNRSEAILRVGLFCKYLHMIAVSPGPGPIALKPGDIAINNIGIDINATIGNLKSSPSSIATFWIELYYVNTVGVIEQKEFELGTVRGVEGSISESSHLIVSFSSGPRRLDITKFDSMDLMSALKGMANL